MDLSRFYPMVVRSSPTDGQRDVPQNVQIDLTFSVDLHASVLTTAEINKHMALIEQTTDRSVPLQLVLPPAPQQTKKIRLEPSGSLSPNTTYVLLIYGTLPAYTGRTSGTQQTITFRTASAALNIPKPTILSPSLNSQPNRPVVLSWEGWSDPPAGYTLLYRVEVARDERFSDIDWYSVGASSTVTVPDSVLNDGVYYFWRAVCLLQSQSTGVVLSGEWSDLFGFYVGTPAAAPGDVGSSITSSLDEYSLTMLAGDGWPYIRLDNVPTGSTFRLRWRGADGWPSWAWEDVPFTVQPITGVAGAYQIVPDSDSPINRLVHLEVLSGSTRIWEKFFYGKLRPMYCHPDSVRVRVSDLIDTIDEDELCFIIYRKSLEANRHWLRWFAPTAYGAGPLEHQVRTADLNQYFAVQRWVELQAAIELLSRQALALSTVAGRNQRLGDFADTGEGYALREIWALRQSLKKESTLWLSEFSRLRATAVSGSKSALNPAYWPGGRHEWPSRDWRRHMDRGWRR